MTNASVESFLWEDFAVLQTKGAIPLIQRVLHEGKAFPGDAAIAAGISVMRLRALDVLKMDKMISTVNLSAKTNIHICERNQQDSAYWKHISKIMVGLIEHFNRPMRRMPLRKTPAPRAGFASRFLKK